MYMYIWMKIIKVTYLEYGARKSPAILDYCCHNIYTLGDGIYIVYVEAIIYITHKILQNSEQPDGRASVESRKSSQEASYCDTEALLTALEAGNL